MVGGPGNDIFEYSGSQFSGGEIEDFTKGEDTITFAFSNADVRSADLDNLLRNAAQQLGERAGPQPARPRIHHVA